MVLAQLANKLQSFLLRQLLLQGKICNDLTQVEVGFEALDTVLGEVGL